PLRDWQKLRIGADEVPRHFTAGANVGVLLGAPSHDLVDVDLDCPEAISLAPLMLPSTWTFGRSSKPRSHFLYISPDVKTERFRAPGGDVLLELRGIGAQTVMPGSVHPSGQHIEWTEISDSSETPTRCAAPRLRARSAKLAAAALVMRVAGEVAARFWVGGGRCPELPPDVARLVRRRWGL